MLITHSVNKMTGALSLAQAPFLIRYSTQIYVSSITAHLHSHESILIPKLMIYYLTVYRKHFTSWLHHRTKRSTTRRDEILASQVANRSEVT